jgi:hypothetical protein
VNFTALPSRLTRSCRSRTGSPIVVNGTSALTLETSSSDFALADSATVFSDSSDDGTHEGG